MADKNTSGNGQTQPSRPANQPSETPDNDGEQSQAQ